jgi:hypothetical protein
MLNIMAIPSVICDWIHAPWIEAEAKVIEKSSAEVVRENLDALVSLTNPATETMLLLPISTSAAKKREFHLHLDFIGMKAKMPVSQMTFDSVREGDRIKLKFRPGRHGKIRSIKILEVIKKDS